MCREELHDLERPASSAGCTVATATNVGLLSFKVPTL